MEDETLVRLLACKFLQKRGYTVLEAGHGEEALQLGRHHAGWIDLLVTDVMMPDINGPMLAAQLTQFRPDLKVLYISGYADEILQQYQTQNREITLLEKPFSSDALAHKVREVLDTPISRMGEQHMLPQD